MINKDVNNDLINSIYKKFGYFINIWPEYYKTGINWCWQITWAIDAEEAPYFDGTCMYGDNAEYDSYSDAFMAALNYLNENPKLINNMGK